MALIIKHHAADFYGLWTTKVPLNPEALSLSILKLAFTILYTILMPTGQRPLCLPILELAFTELCTTSLRLMVMQVNAKVLGGSLRLEYQF